MDAFGPALAAQARHLPPADYGALATAYETSLTENDVLQPMNFDALLAFELASAQGHRWNQRDVDAHSFAEVHAG